MAAINAFQQVQRFILAKKTFWGYGHFKIFGFTQAKKRGKVNFFCRPTRMEAKEKATSLSHLSQIWKVTERLTPSGNRAETGKNFKIVSALA